LAHAAIFLLLSLIQGEYAALENERKKTVTRGMINCIDELAKWANDGG